MCGSAHRSQTGLDPSCAPAGIPSNSSDGEGCWGGNTEAETDVVLAVVLVPPVPVGRSAVPRVVVPRAAAQQLGDPPHITPALARRRDHGRASGGGCGCDHGPDGRSSFGGRPAQPPGENNFYGTIRYACHFKAESNSCLEVYVETELYKSCIRSMGNNGLPGTHSSQLSLLSS
jgi:hypothetical protein